MRLATNLAIAAMLAACGGPTASDSPTNETSSGTSTDPIQEGSGESPPEDACAALGFSSRVGYRPLPSPLPEGVTQNTEQGVDHGVAAAAWQRPPTIELTVDDVTSEEAGTLLVRGELVNRGEAPADVFLWDAGLGFFRAGLSGDGVSLRPASSQGPREIYPRYSRFVLAPGARWPLGATIVLACWRFPPGGAARVHWGLQLAGTEPTGELPLTLP